MLPEQTQVNYRIDDKQFGPRSLDEVRAEIRSGLLQRNIPIQLIDDGIWTDLDGIERKLVARRKAARKMPMSAWFIGINAAVILVSFHLIFWPLLYAACAYTCAVVVRYFEIGRKSPAAAFATLVTSLLPFLPVHVFTNVPRSALTLWLQWTALGQFALFCGLVSYYNGLP